MIDTLETRNWRYATKKFDRDKKISRVDLATLLEAVRLSPSSYGLQPYRIIVVNNTQIRKKLRHASWDQSQIEDASHLIVFAHERDFGEELVDNYIQKTMAARDLKIEQVQGYADFMKSKLLPMTQIEKSQWTAKQAYLALGNVMQAAAELKIDTCPMEGIVPEKYNHILGLGEKLNTAVVLTVGYRSMEDQTQHLPKVRKSKEDLFTFI